MQKHLVLVIAVTVLFWSGLPGAVAHAQTCEERLSAARNEVQAALTIDGTFIFPRWKQDLVQIVVLQQQLGQAQADVKRLQEEVDILKKPPGPEKKGGK